MKLALFGATGNTGQRILREALSREHQVTVIVRDPARFHSTYAHVKVVKADVTDPASVAEAVKGHDAVISAITL